MPDLDIVLLAGEPSGDLQGAKLIEQLLSINPNLKIGAVAGPKMRAFPIECIEPMESLQVMGFLDVALALPKLTRLFFSLRDKILQRSPKVFVGIDYPGFNLRLHRSLKARGFSGKLIHYICPTVWAWGKKRIDLLAQNVDLLLTILPFEPACFAHTTLPVQYVGHPLTAPIASFIPDSTFRSRYNLAPNAPLCALFPGSRKHEIERNLPLQIKTAQKLGLSIAISAASPERSLQIAAIAPNIAQIPAEDTYNLMHNAHLAIAKSGTVTLELALHNVPTVVTYAIHPFDQFLATRIFRIQLPYYALPNLIARDLIFPELFGHHFTEKNLLDQSLRLLEDSCRSNCLKKCLSLRSILGNTCASQNAAKAIFKILPTHSSKSPIF